MKVITRFLLGALLLSHGLLQAQPWRSKLYPTDWTPKGNFYTDAFLQDFSYAGYARREREIPTILTGIVNVTLPPYSVDNSGSTDVTAKLQKAIDDVSAAGGGVVYLPAGTYKVNPGSNNSCLRISKSNVVLRGAGPTKTFIFNSTYKMNGKSILSVQAAPNWYGSNANLTAITQNLTGPTTVIPVKDASAYKKGDLVVLRNQITDAWITEHGMKDFWLGKGGNLKGLAFCREVMAVDVANNKITIDIPIRYSLLTRDNSSVAKITGMISEVGVENLAIGNVQNPATTGYLEEDHQIAGTAAADCHNSYALNMGGVINGWISQVVSYCPKGNTYTCHILSNGILLNQCKNVTVQDCHFQRPQYGGGGGNGYMYRSTGNDNLIIRSIAEFNRHGFVFSSMSANGNVVHNCVDKTSGKATGAKGLGGMPTNGKGSDHHMHFSTSNLIDKCTVINSYFAAGFRNFGGTPIHGITAAHSVFWNTSSSGTAFPQAVHTQQGRYGYAIGTSGSVTKINTDFFSYAPSVSITAPLDIAEGEGLGKTLTPQSLYLDQLARRKGTSNPCAQNALPTVVISTTSGSNFAKGTVVLVASPKDTDGTIAGVDFYQDGVLKSSDSRSPFTCTVSGLATGTFAFAAKATDNCGGTGSSSILQIKVSQTTNAAPTVLLTNPTKPSTVAGTSITLTANADDADGSVAKVEFYAGTTKVGEDLTTPYSLVWTPSAPGTYAISAKAIDNLGASAVTTSIPVVVRTASNQAPTVTLTATPGASGYISPATILLVASPKDVDGTITKVDFYIGKTLLVSKTTTPFQHSWAGVGNGTYTVTAVAFDNAGSSTVSIPVIVKVTDPVVTTYGISGPSCLAAGALGSLVLNPESGAISASWWCNADAKITVNATDYKKATIQLYSASNSIVVNCGVNFSKSPYYKEYTKTIKIGGCTAKAENVSITPYPAEETAVVKSEVPMTEISILNLNGVVLYTQKLNGETEKWISPDVPSGMYIIQLHTHEGTISKPYLKIR